MTEGKKSWCGCLAVGCLLVVVALAVGGYYAYIRTIRFGRNIAAEALVTLVAGVTQANLDKSTQAKVMIPIQSLAQQIRDGKVSLQQTSDLGKAFLASPLIPAMVTSAFEKKYIQTPEMPQVEQESARQIISRFTRGICDGKVETRQINSVMEIIQIETVKEGRKIKTLKEQLTPEELQNCLHLMKEVADAANIEEKTFDLDLRIEIEKIIEKGMKGEK